MTIAIKGQGTVQCAYFTRGSTTFKEAYLRTGRILNISVVPADRYSSVSLVYPILLFQ